MASQQDNIGLYDDLLAQGAERLKAQEQNQFMEQLAAYSAAGEKRREQQLEFALIGLLVLFGGLFLLSFLAKRRRQITEAGENAVVSALASIVKAKRRASTARDRLKAKVDEKLDGEKSPPERP